MASAMINGLLTTGFSPLQLRAADPSEEALEGLRALGIQNLNTSSEHLCDGADLIVAAVKPQIMQAVVTPLASKIKPDTLIVSVAAGVPVNGPSGNGDSA